jgi:hypothetical protein
VLVALSFELSIVFFENKRDLPMNRERVDNNGYSGIRGPVAQTLD